MVLESLHGLHRLDQPEYLLGCVSHIFSGVFWIHGLLQGDDGAEDREKGVDPGIIAGCRFPGDAAGKGKDRLMEFFGDPGHSHRGLSHDSLPVQTALSGDHQVGILHILPQLRFLQNDLDPGFQDCAGEG